MIEISDEKTRNSSKLGLTVRNRVGAFNKRGLLESNDRSQKLLNYYQDRIHELTPLSTQDGMTGFLNEYGIHDEILFRLAELSRHPERRFGFIITDLKNFAFLNDNLGYVMGDSILKLVTGIIRANTRLEDKQWRIGGDEFAVLLQIDSEKQLKEFLFSARHDRAGTKDLPSWLDSVNMQIESGLKMVVKSTDLANFDFEDAGQLRGGYLFIDQSWINAQPEGTMDVDRIILAVKNQLQNIKDKDLSTPRLKGLKIAQHQSVESVNTSI